MSLYCFITLCLVPFPSLPQGMKITLPAESKNCYPIASEITHVYLRETGKSNLRQSTKENKFLQDYISNER